MIYNSSKFNISLFFLFLTQICLIKTLKVDTKSSLFIDQYNRSLIYHGVNVVFKTFPFYPETEKFNSNFSLTDMDLYNLKHWGMNTIRLHVAW
jgi:endoglycosylceramidase